MKKTLVATLALGLFLTGCEKEDSLSSVNETGVRFTAYMTQTRATDTNWEAGDVIGIYMRQTAGSEFVDTNIRYTNSAEDVNTFTSETPVTYQGDAAVDFMAVYPFKEGITDGNYSFTLGDGDLSDNDIMYASIGDVAAGTDNVSLTFHHKLAKIVLQLSDESSENALTGATVKVSIDKQCLSGTLNVADGTISVIEGATYDGTLTFADAGDGTYQAIVIPDGGYEGRNIKIEVTNSEGTTTTYSCPVEKIAFDASTKYTILVSLQASSSETVVELKVSGMNIEDWIEGKTEGYILSTDATVSTENKTATELAANQTLEANGLVEVTPTEGMTLSATDVYSIEYSRTDATSAATLTVSQLTSRSAGKTFTLPANMTEGELLFSVGEFLSGISISSSVALTLNTVSVYSENASSSDEEEPEEPSETEEIVLWSGESVFADDWSIGFALDMTVNKPNAGDILRFYYKDRIEGAQIAVANQTIDVTEDSEYIDITVTEEMAAYFAGEDWPWVNGQKMTVTKAVLIRANGSEPDTPADEDPDTPSEEDPETPSGEEIVLWTGESVFVDDWSVGFNFDMTINKPVAGDVLRFYYKDRMEGAQFGIAEKQFDVTEDAEYIDIAVTEEMATYFAGENWPWVNGQKMTMTKVTLIPSAAN